MGYNMWEGWKTALFVIMIPISFMGWVFWEFVFWLFHNLHWG